MKLFALPLVFILVLAFVGCHKSSPEADLILAYETYENTGEVELIRLANVGKFKRQDSLRILYRAFRVKKNEIFEQLAQDSTDEAIIKRDALSGEYKGTELEDDYQLIESYKFDKDGIIGYKYSADFKVNGQDSLIKNTYLLNEAKSKVLGKL
ncbi:MAG: hypothetical protein AAF502_04550 [Bacteroidota bacterium]